MNYELQQKISFNEIIKIYKINVTPFTKSNVMFLKVIQKRNCLT